MLERYEIENVEQLRAVADILRLRIIDKLLQRPMTVTQLGEELGIAPAKVHYHVRELERVGLLRLVETREKGGILEKYYQPIAREFSVEKGLLSAPPDEAVAMLGSWLGQVRDGFLAAFRQALEAKNEQPGMSIGHIHLYMTLEEQKKLAERVGELLKPYEQPRGVEGERELLATILLYPEEKISSPAPLPVVQPLQAVGSINITRSDLEQALREGKRLQINVVGICTFDDDISAELANLAIERFHVIGKLFAPPEVREVLLSKQRE